MSSPLTTIRKRYEHELYEVITPFWEKYGVNHQTGGFYNCLDRDGSVYDTSGQMWMQWRMVYMFAALYNGGTHEPRWLEIAERGFDFLYRHGRKDTGGYVYRLDGAGRVAALAGDNGAEIFTDSFAALAGAELYRATGNQLYRNAADRCRRVYQTAVARRLQSDPKCPGAVPRRALAYPMIQLNMLNVMEKSGLAEAPEIVETVTEIMRFRHPESGVLCENILPKGDFDFTTPAGRLVNPGHALEGLWFIMAHEAVHPNRVFRKFGLQSIALMLDYGWDRESGGIRYFQDIRNLPPRAKEYMLKAWWPQCEAATAALFAYCQSGRSEFWDWFCRIDEFAWRELRDPEYPEWFAYARIEGKIVHRYKGSDWKAFFHLPRYLLNCIELLKTLENTPRCRSAEAVSSGAHTIMDAEDLKQHNMEFIRAKPSREPKK